MSGDISRRRWIAQSVSLALAAMLPPAKAWSAPAADLVIGGGRFKEAPEGPTKFVLVKANATAREVATIPAAFFPHGFAYHPRQGHLVAAFEKIGPGAGVFDLRAMRAVETIAPQAGRHFYGHGAYSEDAKLLYSTETIVATGAGAIGVRDARSFKVLGDFPTHGDNPHDCRLIEGGKVLAVTNGGGNTESGRRGSLCFVEVGSGRLLDRFEIGDDRFNAGHVETLPGRGAIVVSAPRLGLPERQLGAVSVRRAGGALQLIREPGEVTQRMSGEALSVVALPEAGLFLVTHPTPGMVTCWDLASRRLRKVLELPGARGLTIAKDRRSVLVSYGPRASLGRIDVASLSLVAGSVLPSTFITGSHLSNWAGTTT